MAFNPGQALGDVGSMFQHMQGTALRGAAAAGYHNAAMDEVGGLEDRTGNNQQQFENTTTQYQDSVNNSQTWYNDQTGLGDPNNNANSYTNVNAPKRVSLTDDPSEVGGRTGIAMETYNEIVTRGDEDLSTIRSFIDKGISETDEGFANALSSFKKGVGNMVAGMAPGNNERLADYEAQLQTEVATKGLSPAAATKMLRQEANKEVAKTHLRMSTANIKAERELADIHMQRGMALGQANMQGGQIYGQNAAAFRGQILQAGTGVVSAFAGDEAAARDFLNTTMTRRVDTAERIYNSSAASINRAMTRMFELSTTRLNIHENTASLVTGVAASTEAGAPGWSQTAANQQTSEPPQSSGGMFG